MSALTAALRGDIRTSDHGLPAIESFVVESGKTLYHRALVGIYHGVGANAALQGQIAPYVVAEEGLRFAGIHFGDDIVGDGTKKSTVFQGGCQVYGAVVANSGSSKPGTQVYATTDNLADLDVRSPGGVDEEPIGYLVFQRGGSSSTTWDVQLYPITETGLRSLKRQGQEQVLASTHALITADGAINKATLFHNCVQYIRGTSSAALTLAVPTAAEVGQVWHFKRSAGTGTHDIDYTDELGQAVTVVLGDGDVCSLLAVSTTGYRRLA